MSLMFRSVVKTCNLYARSRDTGALVELNVDGAARKGNVAYGSHHEHCMPAHPTTLMGTHRGLVSFCWQMALCVGAVASFCVICFCDCIVSSPALPLIMSVSASTAILLAAPLSIPLLMIVVGVLANGLQKELTEARDASVELARETIAFETLLRSHSAAAVIKASQEKKHDTATEGAGSIAPSAGLSVTAAAVRAAAYKLVRRGRFDSRYQDHKDAVFGSPLTIGVASGDPSQDSGAHNSGSDGFFPEVRVLVAEPRAQLKSQAGSTSDRDDQQGSVQPSASGEGAASDAEDPLELTRDFLKIMKEILPDNIQADSTLPTRERRRRDVVSQLRAGGAGDCWSDYPDYEVEDGPSASQALDNPVVRFINPLRLVSVALGAEANEVLDAGRDQPCFFRWRRPQDKSSFIEALDLIADVYSCHCFRRNRNFEPMGYPGLGRLMAANQGKDLAQNLKRHVSMLRPSLGYGQEGVKVYKVNEPELEDVEELDPCPLADEEDALISTDGVPLRFSGYSIADNKPLIVSHRFYGDRGLSRGANGESALFRDIGRAELLVAPFFLAKTFLTDAYSNKRRTRYEQGRPWYDFLYGAKLRKYSVLVTICAVVTLMLSAFSVCFLIDTSAALGKALVALHILGGIYAVQVSVVAFAMSCRFFGGLEQAARGIADNFPAVKQYLFDKKEDDFAVKSVGDFLETCSKGADFPALEPIGGRQFWR